MAIQRKKRVPDHLRRVLVFGRVAPRSAAYLESMKEPNLGRAIDRLCEAHRSIMAAIKPELRSQFDKPAKLPLEEKLK